MGIFILLKNPGVIGETEDLEDEEGGVRPFCTYPLVTIIDVPRVLGILRGPTPPDSELRTPIVETNGRRRKKTEIDSYTVIDPT